MKLPRPKLPRRPHATRRRPIGRSEAACAWCCTADEAFPGLKRGRWRRRLWTSTGATGCACDGRLAGADEDLCLPASLCGDGALGATCAGGTADCAPGTTSACEDLGAGPVCTKACAGPDECGAGCCTGR